MNLKECGSSLEASRLIQIVHKKRFCRRFESLYFTFGLCNRAGIIKECERAKVERWDVVFDTFVLVRCRTWNWPKEHDCKHIYSIIVKAYLFFT